MSVKNVTDMEEFKECLQSAGDKLVVVDFYATWCGPCKMIAPQVEEWAKEMADTVFLKVDVDECEDIAQEYGISAMPTFKLLRNGTEVGEFIGANATKLEEAIKTCPSQKTKK